MQSLFLEKVLLYYLPLFLWATLIFIGSSFPGSGYQSYDLYMFLERKGAHILEYAVLVVLFLRVANLHINKLYLQYILSILATFLFAVSDEIHQTFVFGRTGKLTDVLIDVVGILFGVAIWEYFKRGKKKRKFLH